jgi:hypothetical protein
MKMGKPTITVLSVFAPCTIQGRPFRIPLKFQRLFAAFSPPFWKML